MEEEDDDALYEALGEDNNDLDEEHFESILLCKKAERVHRLMKRRLLSLLMAKTSDVSQLDHAEHLAEPPPHQREEKPVTSSPPQPASTPAPTATEPASISRSPSGEGEPRAEERAVGPLDAVGATPTAATPSVPERHPPSPRQTTEAPESASALPAPTSHDIQPEETASDLSIRGVSLKTPAEPLHCGPDQSRTQK